MLARINHYFSSTVRERGEQAYHAGDVLNVRLSDGLLKARTKDQKNQLFDIRLDLKTWPDSDSLCTCIKKTACEHAAASLYALQYGLKPPTLTPTFASFAAAVVEKPIIDADDISWYSHVQKSDHDFFSYQLGVVVDGQSVSLVPVVVEFLQSMDQNRFNTMSDDHTLLLPLPDGQQLRITYSRIKPFIQILIQLGLHAGMNRMDLQLQRYQLLLLEEAEQALKSTSARWEGTENIAERLRPLLDQTTLPPIPLPEGLNATLRDYQCMGFYWLSYLRENHFGGVLADDMGLGKTIQTLTLLQYEKEQGRLQKASLIVAPTSLVMNWWEEAQRFTPQLRVLIFHGFDRHVDTFDDYDVVISTYGVIQRDKKRFLEYPFYYLILDEAQNIKNARTKTALIIQQLPARHRLCLTGTPLENHLGELWSLFHFLMPGLLGNAKHFRTFFRIPIERDADADRQAVLAGRVLPFMLRRTKNEVARELPLKTEITQMIELQGNQRDVYEAIRMIMETKVRQAVVRQGMGKSQMILLDALLKLRQVCCDPRLVKLPHAAIAHGESAKLEAMLALLDGLISEGRCVLIFSQFTSMLSLIEEALVERKYAYYKLTGQTKNRQDLVRRFQEGDVPIFLISLKAGGTGLNLTRADTVILYDPWWNPAVQDQAMDRSHRMGQKKPVFVYKLITSGTVEEVILKIQTQKRQLVQGVFAPSTAGQLTLTEQDLQQFFTPLGGV